MQRALVGTFELLLDVPHHHQTAEVAADEVPLAIHADAAHDVAMTLESRNARASSQLPDLGMREEGGCDDDVEIASTAGEIAVQRADVLHSLGMTSESEYALLGFSIPQLGLNSSPKCNLDCFVIAA